MRYANDELPIVSRQLPAKTSRDIASRKLTAFGMRRARRCKKPPPQVHQVHSIFAFISLGYELVVFCMFIKFTKFIEQQLPAVSCQLSVKAGSNCQRSDPIAALSGWTGDVG